MSGVVSQRSQSYLSSSPPAGKYSAAWPLCPISCPVTSLAQTAVVWSSLTFGALSALLQEPEATSGPQLGSRVNLGAWSDTQQTFFTGKERG